MQGQYEYYAGLSGLTPPSFFSLTDHQRAFWCDQMGISYPSDRPQGSLEQSFYAFNGITEYRELSRARYIYFSERSGLTPPENYSVADHMFAFFTGAGGPVEQRRNLLLNPNGSGANGWDFESWPFTKTSEVATPPTALLLSYTRFTMLSDTSSTLLVTLAGTGTTGIPVTPSVAYIASAYARLVSGTIVAGGLQIIREYNAAGTLINAPVEAAQLGAFTPGTWYRSDNLFTTGVNTAFVCPIFRFGGTNLLTGQALEVGGGLMELGSILDFAFDGDTPDGGGFEYAWLGTANNSLSRQLA